MSDSRGWVQVSRFGVHDPDRGLRGYRLTFRAVGVDDNDVTAAIAGAFADSGIDTLAGTESVLVTTTLPFLTGELPIPFPPGQVVLEMPLGAAQEVGEERLQSLVDEGYELGAIVGDPLSVAVQPTCVHFVLVEASSPNLDAVTSQARADERSSVAVGITDHELLQRAKDAGADLLVGPAVSMPQVVKARALPSSRVTSMRLISMVGDPDVSIRQVEEVAKTDASLSYRLLRVANSAGLGAANPTASVRDAIVRIGLRNLHSWLLLMLVADVADAPEDQLFAAVTRAKACEIVAPTCGVAPGEAFVVGLLSGIAPQLGREPGFLGTELGLDPRLVEALDGAPSPLGRLLKAVERYESGDLDVAELAEGAVDPAGGPSGFDVAHAWLAAMGWSLQAVRAATGVTDA